jgi:hypothetical protein
MVLTGLPRQGSQGRTPCVASGHIIHADNAQLCSKVCMQASGQFGIRSGHHRCSADQSSRRSQGANSTGEAKQRHPGRWSDPSKDRQCEVTSAQAHVPASTQLVL